MSVKPFIIGIAGGSGSGKSTVARNVAKALDAESVAFIDLDANYLNFVSLSLAERRQLNWEPRAAFTWALPVGQSARPSRGGAIDHRACALLPPVRPGQRSPPRTGTSPGLRCRRCRAGQPSTPVGWKLPLPKCCRRYCCWEGLPPDRRPALHPTLRRDCRCRVR
mgnify:CR=1 FL=1